MNNQLQPGGLALVVQSFIPENLMQIVTLVRLVQPGEIFKDPNGDSRLYADKPAAWFVEGGGIIGLDGDKGFGVFEPCALMPIKPDAEPASTTAADEYAHGGSF